MKSYTDKNSANELLLNAFNNGDSAAYEQVYSMFYKEFHYYSATLYKDSEVDCKDIIQDIFLEIIENKKLKFDSFDKIKGYIFIAIKHKFANYCRHKKIRERVLGEQIKESDYFILQAVEAEIISLLPEVLKLVPQECAELIRLSLEGYSIKEISAKVNKPITTLYSQREKAISILRNKLPKDKMFFILFI